MKFIIQEWALRMTGFFLLGFGVRISTEEISMILSDDVGVWLPGNKTDLAVAAVCIVAAFMLFSAARRAAQRATKD